MLSLPLFKNHFIKSLKDFFLFLIFILGILPRLSLASCNVIIVLVHILYIFSIIDICIKKFEFEFDPTVWNKCQKKYDGASFFSSRSHFRNFPSLHIRSDKD